MSVFEKKLQRMFERPAPPAPTKKRDETATERETERLRLEGYEIAPDGRVVCAFCGTYCGQCGIDRTSASMAEYRRRFWGDRKSD